MTREEAEEVVAQLMYKSFLDFEFGYTVSAKAPLCPPTPNTTSLPRG